MVSNLRYFDVKFLVNHEFKGYIRFVESLKANSSSHVPLC